MSPGKRHFRERATAAWRKGHATIDVPPRWLAETLDAYTRWKVAALAEAVVIVAVALGFSLSGLL